MRSPCAHSWHVCTRISTSLLWCSLNAAQLGECMATPSESRTSRLWRHCYPKKEQTPVTCNTQSINGTPSCVGLSIEPHVPAKTITMIGWISLDFTFSTNTKRPRKFRNFKQIYSFRTFYCEIIADTHTHTHIFHPLVCLFCYAQKCVQKNMSFHRRKIQMRGLAANTIVRRSIHSYTTHLVRTKPSKLFHTVEKRKKKNNHLVGASNRKRG